MCYDPSILLGTSQPLLLYRPITVTQVMWPLAGHPSKVEQRASSMLDSLPASGERRCLYRRRPPWPLWPGEFLPYHLLSDRFNILLSNSTSCVNRDPSIDWLYLTAFDTPLVTRTSLIDTSCLLRRDRDHNRNVIIMKNINKYYFI